MKKINILSEETIIKIAAGEVIENPASIIKELVENSIDAGSTKISIEIAKNGAELIKITDNGVGMSKDDLLIAFKRHTTSKIIDIEDLEHTFSLGFRGEALSSIAAVSEVEIITKTENDEVGIHATIDHKGNIIRSDEIATNNGTTILCRNLFLSMPVRRNYLENKNFEITKTNDIINRLALSNPHISMDYVKDSDLIIKTNKDRDLLSNLYTVLGNNVGNNLIYFEEKAEDISIHGYVSNNLLFRGNRNSQFLYVNNRTIFNQEIGKSIEKAYSSIIPLNRFPVFVVYINIDPTKLDVNIHPKKSLIKILNSDFLNNKIEDIVKNAISESLKVPNIAEIKTNKPETIFQQQNIEDISIVEAENISEKLVEIRDYSSDYEVATTQNTEPNNTEKYREVNKSPKGETKITIFPNGYRYIGNLFLQYILLEDNIDKVLYVLDQHAIHERINYEKLADSYRSGSITSQHLMSGYVVEFTKNEFEKLIRMREKLLSLGIEIEEFGDNSIVIRSLPVFLSSESPEQILIDILESEKNIDSLYEFDPYKIMRIACKSSIKSGQNLSSLEVQRLIEELNNCEMPLTCPHGRPTMIKVSNKWLEKEFFRIQS